MRRAWKSSLTKLTISFLDDSLVIPDPNALVPANTSDKPTASSSASKSLLSQSQSVGKKSKNKRK